MQGRRLAGHEDVVDDVDDAVGLEDIRGGDDGHIALCVGERDLVAHHGDGKILALDGLESGLAAALLNHRGELFGAYAACDDVVGENLVESGLVLRLDESVDGTGGKLGEGVIGRGEDGEGAEAVEGCRRDRRL